MPQKGLQGEKNIRGDEVRGFGPNESRHDKKHTKNNKKKQGGGPFQAPHKKIFSRFKTAS